jgi:hypothetical protein
MSSGVVELTGQKLACFARIGCGGERCVGGLCELSGSSARGNGVEELGALKLKCWLLSILNGAARWEIAARGDRFEARSCTRSFQLCPLTTSVVGEGDVLSRCAVPLLKTP